MTLKRREKETKQKNVKAETKEWTKTRRKENSLDNNKLVSSGSVVRNRRRQRNKQKEGEDYEKKFMKTFECLNI